MNKASDSYHKGIEHADALGSCPAESARKQIKRW
jgi:hypothetical protein